MKLFTHRRFAYLWEFDRRGAPYSGTAEQQNPIRQALLDIAPFDSRLDLVLRKLAKVVKAKGPKYANIQFETGIPFGRANWMTVYLNVHETNPDILVSTFFHELGHVIGINFWSDTSEGWAEEFKNWVFGGQVDGPIWDRLKEVI